MAHARWGGGGKNWEVRFGKLLSLPLERGRNERELGSCIGILDTL